MNKIILFKKRKRDRKMSYKREINRYGKVKHIVKENDNLVIGIFKPNIFKELERKFNFKEITAIVDIGATFPLNNEIKKKATCKEPDVFNKNIGMDIVDLKIMLDYHQKTIRRYETTINRLTKLIDKISNYIKEEEETINNIKEELNKYEYDIDK